MDITRDEMTKGQRRKRQILKESIELIKVDGLEGLTMKKVAERVGITEASAYRYFPHKRDLLASIIATMSNRLLQPIRDLRDSEKPAEERLLLMAIHQIDFVLKEDGLPLIFLTEVAGAKPLEMADKIQEIISDIHDIFKKTIRELVPEGTPISTEVLTLSLTGIAAMLAIQRRVGIKVDVRREVSEQLIPAIIAFYKTIGRTGTTANDNN